MQDGKQRFAQLNSARLLIKEKANRKRSRERESDADDARKRPRLQLLPPLHSQQDIDWWRRVSIEECKRFLQDMFVSAVDKEFFDWSPDVTLSTAPYSGFSPLRMFYAGDTRTTESAKLDLSSFQNATNLNLAAGDGAVLKRQAFVEGKDGWFVDEDEPQRDAQLKVAGNCTLQLDAASDATLKRKQNCFLSNVSSDCFIDNKQFVALQSEAAGADEKFRAEHPSADFVSGYDRADFPAWDKIETEARAAEARVGNPIQTRAAASSASNSAAAAPPSTSGRVINFDSEKQRVKLVCGFGRSGIQLYIKCGDSYTLLHDEISWSEVRFAFAAIFIR